MRKQKILIVEDEPTMRFGMSHLLNSAGYEIVSAKDGLEGIEYIENKVFDLIITDLRLPKINGLSILQRAKELSSHTGVIIITAYADVKTAVEAIKQGAFDYLSKPFSNEELLICIERFFQFKNLKDEVTNLRASLQERKVFNYFIGSSSKMREVFDKISAVAVTDVSVLIQGESGTGKELVANAIQQLSLRKDKPFVKINCAAIPESLFEDELFGHEKGAFTSAVELRKGKFEVANTGTIFFDEIADMPLNMQAKLLRVIEDGSITRLGGNSTIKVDVRFLYATSKNLTELIKKGTFRDDLFHRINVVPILLPPLRHRREDIAELVEYFLNQFGKKYNKPDLTISPEAYQHLMTYEFYGNVRELKHLIEKAVLLCKQNVIDKSVFTDNISKDESSQSTNLQDNIPLNQKLMYAEINIIKEALKESNGKKQEAAKKLGISRKALWQKIKEYGL